MKYCKILFPLLLLVIFTGCLDVQENINVRKDGTGDYTMKIDMSQMVELLQTYVGKEELEKKGMTKMDTTVYMKDIVDTLSGLSAEKKELLRPGNVHVRVNLDEKIFLIKMLFPFNNPDNLQKLYATMTDGSLGTTQLLKGIAPGGAGEEMGGAGSNADINQFNGIYDFTSKDGLISKKINQAKWKELQDNPQMAQLKEAGKMGVEVLYTTTIQLPRAVKKTGNPLAKLSEDRKTVVIKYNLMDLFDHPEQFGFAIEY